MRPSFRSSRRSSAKGGRAIPDEALSSLVIAGVDAHRALDVEAVVRRREARLLANHVLLGGGALLGEDGPAHERAAREREAREGVDGGVGSGLAAAVLGEALVEVAVTAQPDEGAIVDTSGDFGDVRLRGRRRLVQA